MFPDHVTRRPSMRNTPFSRVLKDSKEREKKKRKKGTVFYLARGGAGGGGVGGSTTGQKQVSSDTGCTPALAQTRYSFWEVSNSQRTSKHIFRSTCNASTPEPQSMSAFFNNSRGNTPHSLHERTRLDPPPPPPPAIDSEEWRQLATCN